MKKLLGLLILAFAMLCAATASAAIRVFSCEPEWTALLNELAADKIRVFTATTALQDVHKIQARPSLLAAARNADMLVCTGADLEVGWLPVLIAQSGNRNIQPGSPGYIEAAMLVDRLEIPASVDRALGDLHPRGIPHVQLDPRNIVPIAVELTKHLSEIDRPNAAFYDARLKDFSQRWQQALPHWEAKAAPLRGLPVVQREKDFAYLFAWLGIEHRGMLEPKPGLEPTIGHMSELLTQHQKHPVKAVVRAPYQAGKAAEWFSGRANVPSLVLPTTIGGSGGATNLFTLFDDAIDRLLRIGAPG